MERNSQLIIVLVMLAVILVGFGLFIAFAPEKKAPEAKTFDPAEMVTPTSYASGPKDAKVVLAEWGDFQCPFCAQEAPVLERIIADYKDNPNFTLVFRHLPLPQHTNARAAAEAAEAAGAQGKFWEMYHVLYANQNAWANARDPRPLFATYADQLGLNRAQFDAALDAGTYADVVEADYKKAIMLGINSTPTLVLNGVQLTNPSYEAIKAAIDEALAATTTAPVAQ